MTRSCNVLRLWLVVFVAIAGLVSTAGAASASASTEDDSAPTGTRGCCLNRTRAACCCCREPSGARPSLEPFGPPALLPAHDVRLAGPAHPCQCRTGEPATPAVPDRSRPAEGRTAGGRGEPAGPTFLAPAAFARLCLVLVPPAGSAADAPVYLRTARLLI